MNDDEDLFAAEMSGVAPLKTSVRLRLQQGRMDDEEARERQRSASEDRSDRNHLSDTEVELLDPYMPLEFKRPGVQHGVFKRLKQGAYGLDARLDLHGMTVEQARREVFSFLEEALAHDLRTAIIVHGRGRHSHSRGPVLKSYTNVWLRDLDAVQAFASAQPRHGGVGAVYVLLRKSENKKQQNRERLSKGRSR